MIALSGALSDEETSVGISYFLAKYGFSRTFFDSLIPLQQDDAKAAPFPDTIAGWITWKGCRLPVLFPPDDLSGRGSAFLEFSDGGPAYPCGTVDGGDIFISIDIFRHLGFFVSGSLEKIWSRRKDERDPFIKTPFGDYYSDIAFSCMVRAQEKKGLPLVYKSFWPGGKSSAVCLTHDIDEIRKTYQWLTHPARQIFRRDLGGLLRQYRSFVKKIHGEEPYWTFDTLADLEDSLGVRSSLFFLNETGKVLIRDKETWRHAGRRYEFSDPRVRAVLRDLFQRNWDIGLHGSFYSYTDEKMLRSEKEKLETALGHTVFGGRQHNLNLRIPETWLCQEKAGLTYDSTLGYNDCMGFRWGISFPFRPYLPEENRFGTVLQVPLAIEDLPYFRSPSRWEDFLNIQKSVNASGGMITLLWHHSIFNETEFPGWAEDYARMIAYCLKNDAWVTDAKSIAQWWAQRECASFRFTFDGGILKITAVSDSPGCCLDIVLPPDMMAVSLQKTIIIKKVNNILTLRTPPLNRSEFVAIELSGPSHGN